MRQTLSLQGIGVRCVLGDLPEERNAEREVFVDVALEMDLAKACGSDDLADTLDYAALVTRIRAVLKEARCRLIERAAACVVEVCLEDRRVTSARVTLRKPHAVPGLDAAAVTLLGTR